jgi:uncharacterized membrane protein YhaH (DUF805 family)
MTHALPDVAMLIALLALTSFRLRKYGWSMWIVLLLLLAVAASACAYWGRGVMALSLVFTLFAVGSFADQRSRKHGNRLS